MAIYTIYAPALVGDVARAFDRARIVESGFSRSAFVFGPLWLLAKGLWLPLGIWAIVAAGAGYADVTGWLARGGASAIYALSALLIGLEGRGWLGDKFARAGLPLVDVVEARNEEEAARVFLGRAANAPAPAPATGVARAAGARDTAHIIGLFPEGA